MVRFFSIRPVYCLFLTVLITVGGCQQTTNSLREIYGYEPSQEKRAEDLLNKDEVAMREEAQPLSPIEQHMKARGDVDPKKVNRKNRFSKTVDDYEKDQDDKVRVVRVDENLEGLADQRAGGIKIDNDPVGKRENAKNYIQRILDKHRASQQARLNGEDVAPKAVKVAPKEKAKVVVAQPSAQVSVQDLRIGQHPGKTRIVMDVSGKTSFQARLENGGRRLVVTLPNAVWATNAQMKVSEENIIRQYRADDKGRGSIVRVELNAPGRLAYKSDLKPSNGRGHRIVLDVVSK